MDREDTSLHKLLYEYASEIKELSGLCEQCGVDTMHTFELNNQKMDLCLKCY